MQAKKTKGGNSGLKKTETSKESKMTAEERHARKEVNASLGSIKS